MSSIHLELAKAIEASHHEQRKPSYPALTTVASDGSGHGLSVGGIFTRRARKTKPAATTTVVVPTAGHPVGCAV